MFNNNYSLVIYYNQMMSIKFERVFLILFMKTSGNRDIAWKYTKGGTFDHDNNTNNIKLN